MTEQVKTSREIYGNDPEIGYEWDAGYTPPHIWPGGRWTVRLTEAGWDVIFHPFKEGRPDDVLATFPPGGDGERQAKSHALALLDRAWRRDD